MDDHRNINALRSRTRPVVTPVGSLAPEHSWVLSAGHVSLRRVVWTAMTSKISKINDLQVMICSSQIGPLSLSMIICTYAFAEFWNPRIVGFGWRHKGYTEGRACGTSWLGPEPRWPSAQQLTGQDVTRWWGLKLRSKLLAQATPYTSYHFIWLRVTSYHFFMLLLSLHF